MELNAEKVKKALECCYMQELEHNENCPECPYTDLYPDCVEYLGKHAYTLITEQEQRIKELEADNEYLRTQITATEARAESRKESDLAELLELRLKVEELTEENERLLARNFDLAEKGENVCIAYKKLSEGNKRLRADTVREFAERFLSLLEEEYRKYTPENADNFFKNGSYMMWATAERVFNQIAKEMEGE